MYVRVHEQVQVHVLYNAVVVSVHDMDMRDDGAMTCDVMHVTSHHTTSYDMHMHMHKCVTELIEPDVVCHDGEWRDSGRCLTQHAHHIRMSCHISMCVHVHVHVYVYVYVSMSCVVMYMYACACARTCFSSSFFPIDVVAGVYILHVVSMQR